MPSPPPAHSGVAADDPRNRRVIEFFRPKEVTVATVRERLAHALPRLSPADVQARAEQFMAKLAGKPVKAPPPLSQSLDDVDDPLYGLSTHPDIISRLWKLDRSLPQRCRCVLWGRPALVHPQTGVVFAVGYGSIGLVMRLPADIRRQATPEQASAVIPGNPGQTFDISPAGPEWRFLRQHAPENAWVRGAYDFAAAQA